jgi:hypothetical protein
VIQLGFYGDVYQTHPELSPSVRSPESRFSKKKSFYEFPYESTICCNLHFVSRINAVVPTVCGCDSRTFGAKGSNGRVRFHNLSAKCQQRKTVQ